VLTICKILSIHIRCAFAGVDNERLIPMLTSAFLSPKTIHFRFGFTSIDAYNSNQMVREYTPSCSVDEVQENRFPDLRIHFVKKYVWLRPLRTVHSITDLFQTNTELLHCHL
jgi:hypothetical protein